MAKKLEYFVVFPIKYLVDEVDIIGEKIKQ